MSFALVQFGSNSGNGVGSLLIGFPGNNTAGNCMILVTREPTAAGNSFTITDTQSNNWTLGFTYTNGAEQYQLFYALNIKAGGNIVTMTKTGGGTFNGRGIVGEFSGVALSSAFDSFLTATTTSLPNIVTPLFTPVASSELLIGFFANQTADNVSPTSDWSSVTTQDGNLAMFYKGLPTTPPSSWAATMISPSSQQYAAAIVALASASSGTAVPTFVRQYPFGQLTSGSSVTTTVTMTAGNVGIISLSWNDVTHTVQSVTDTHGNTWSAVPNTLQQNASLNGAAGASLQNWYAPITTGGAGTVITITWTGSTSFPSVIGAEFGNIDTTTTIKASNSQKGNATPQSPTISPTGNVALWGTIYTGNGNTTASPPWMIVSQGAAGDKFFLTTYQLIANGKYSFAGAMSSYNTAAASISGFKAPLTQVSNALMMMGSGI